MSNLELRYYKKPRNKLKKKIFSFVSFLKKRVFLVFIPLVAIISILIFIAIPKITTPTVRDVIINDDKEIFTQLVSRTGSFYAEIEGKKIIANKIGDGHFVNLGKIEKTQQVPVGPYQNFLIFQKTLAPSTVLTVNPKINFNSNFKLNVKDEQNTNMFTYEVETINDDSEYTIFEGDVIIYQKGLVDNKCDKKPDSKTLYICKSAFGDNTKKVLNIKIRDKNFKIYEVSNNKVINLNGAAKVNCTFPKEARTGKNTVNCSSLLDADIFVGDVSYKIVKGKETPIIVDSKVGKNQFLIIGMDENKQKIEQIINYEVSSQFYFELSASKDRFDIQTPTNLEFIINTNEKIIADIFANAKESTKGYEKLNANPIDTNFSAVNFINKDVKIDNSNNSFVFQIDTTSSDNASKKQVYAPIINVEMIFKSESGKNITANCKMFIQVNNQIQDKSICIIKNIN